MALATICPHCHTTFRVASDQLKLRGGIVRCGTCKEVFDGNAALVELDAVSAPAPAAPAAPAASEPTAIDPAPAGPLPVLHNVVQAPADNAAAAIEPVYTLDFDTSLEPAAILSAESTTASSNDASSNADSDTGVRKAAQDRELLVDPFEVLINETYDVPHDAESNPTLSRRFGAPFPALQLEPESERAAVVPAPPVAIEKPPEPPAIPAVVEPAAPLPDPRPVPPPASGDAFAPLLMRASSAAEDRLAPPPSELPSAGPSTMLRAARARTARRAAGAERKAAAVPAAPAVVPAVVPIPVPVAEPAPAPVIEDEPEFVRSSRLREEHGATRRKLLAIGAVALALLLPLQGVWSFRNVLAARYPAARPALAGVCGVLGCKVTLPAQIDSLAVETGELQRLDASTFAFTTLLRNQGELVQSWPHLELALTDASDKTLVRRVFTPVDYLPPGAAAGKGFAGRSEQAVKLVFQLDQIKASGYHLAIFYP